MTLNPINEVKYRLKLAKQYFRDAREAYSRRDYRGTVMSSQLSAENAAKAVIAVFRIPSWSHDPSLELLELIDQLPETVRKNAVDLANIAKTLAPEHGRATYGEPLRGLTPWDIYGEEDARKALKMAEKAFRITQNILRELRINE